MFCCTEAEQALKARFEAAYRHSRMPVMQAIERRVCGCDYGGNSWTSRDQADALMPLLDLGPGTQLVDLGAGTGWPGIYLAKQSGCRVTLVDLPEIGLRIAARRARQDGIADRVTIKVADAAHLPFADRSFDAVSHSDLLCCLVRKRRVLQECRRVVRDRGRMAFTVIGLAPGLTGAARDRALANAPDFVETDTGYRELLEATGWTMVSRLDVTEAYRDSCARQVDADREYRSDLADLLGAEEAAARLAQWRSKRSAIEDGLFLRELFVCTAKQPEIMR